MQTGVEIKSFLKVASIKSSRLGAVKDEIPAVLRNNAGYKYEIMMSEQSVAELLLADARHSRV